MRCLVTGACGHLGSYLTRLLLTRGHEVVGLIRPQSDLFRLNGVLPQIRLIRGDLSDIDRAAEEIVSAAAQVVFHLAWQGVASEYRDDSDQIRCNLSGSLRLLELAQKGGCQCWVGLGSQAEYGRFEGILHEGLPTRPVTVYGVTKLCVGMLSRQLCESAGTRYVWLRLLATYGPKDDPRHLIPSTILKLLAAETPSLTAGEQRWDYLYVEDAAEALYEVAMNSRAQGVFNLGSGEVWSVRRIVERIRGLIDPNLPLGFGEAPYRADQVMHLQADISKLRREIDWRPRMNMDEGLKRTVEWHRANARRTKRGW